MKFFIPAVLILNLIFYKDGLTQGKIVDLMYRDDLTYKEIEQVSNNFFEKNGKQRGSGYKQFQRWFYERQFHMDEDGYFRRPEVEYNNYKSAVRNLKTDAGLRSSDPWHEIGPDNWTHTSGWNPGVGRITSIAVHPSNENIIYVSSPGGGIWKSINGGSTWNALLDNVNSSWMDVYNLCIDPSNVNIVYAAVQTGGVIKSINAGASWTSTGTGPNYSKKVLVHPANSNIVFVTSYNGIWRSVNGGSSWSLVLNQFTEDIEFKPGNPNIMYASGESGTSSFRRSLDNGITWSYVGIANGITHFGRTLIGVSQNSPNTVYVIQAKNNVFGRIYKSLDSGLNFSTAVIGSPQNGTNYFGYNSNGTDTVGQAWYDMSICVNPNNINEVHIGGVACWKSLDGGSSFIPTTEWSYPNSIGYNHADVHALEWVNNTIYSGTDGGIYKSTDNGNEWTDLSLGLGIRQVYRLSNSKTEPNAVTIGSQDNGTSYRRTDLNWVDWLGADGMDTKISNVNAGIAYGTWQNGGLNKTNNSGQTRVYIPQPAEGKWITPIEIDPLDHNIIYGGWNNVYKSNNSGVNWQNLSSGFIDKKLDVLKVSNSNNNYIYASTSDTLYRTVNGGVTWTQMDMSANITSIFISKTDPNKIWLTLNSLGTKVIHSINGGNTFNDISSGLPALPARSVVVDENEQNGVYVGLNIGVYYRNDQNTSWVLFGTNLPLVAINEIEIQESSNKIRVATYGRGVWENNLVVQSYDPISCNDNFIDNGGLAINYTNDENNITVICPEYSNEKIIVTFNSFHTEESFDKLYIYNGPNITSSLMSSGNGPGSGICDLPGGFWGNLNNNLPGPIISTHASGCLTFRFCSDGDGTRSGWEAEVSCCSQSPASIIVNETSEVINDGVICQGAQASLYATGGSSYLWSTGSTDSNIIVSPSITTIYTVSVTNVNGCINTGSITITVLPMPTPAINVTETSGTANNDGTICAGATATLTASGGGTYVWSTGATTAAITTGTTGTYTVTVTNSNNCSASMSRNIIVNPLPNASIIILETSGVINDGTICAGAQASLSATGGTSYQWSTGSTEPTISVNPLITTTYTVTATDSDGCSASVFISIVVDPDTESPEIICPLNLTINCGESILPSNTGQPLIANDNCDNNPSVFYNDVPSGTNCPDGDLIVRIWTVVDISGNNTICVQEIHILSNAISCGDSFYDSGGLNASYSNNANISKAICPENVNEVVQLAFTAFDVQTNYDALYIYNGDDISDPQISSNNPATLSGFPAGGFYGTASPGPFTADNNSGCLTFLFRSDNDITGSGWTADVSCLNRPSNDNCADAILVTCNSTTSGSTRFSRTESPSVCGTNPGNRGVWYKVNVGNQPKNVTINTCSAQTNFDTKINVYVGDCGSFSCITGNDDFCGFRSQVQFSADNNTYYYIFISGFIDATGDFSLTVSCTNIWDFSCGENFNDSGGAGSNYLNNEDMIWTICPESNSSIAKVEFSSFNIESLWDALYVYNGSNINAAQISSGNPQTLSGFPAGGFYGTNIPGPFIADNDTGCLTFRFRSDGTDTRPGWVSNVTCLDRPLNDNCADAILVSCNSMVSGSTIFARSETALLCGTTPGIRGVWYKINVGAQPKYAIINTCSSQTNFDTKINIYVGQCEGFNCIVGNDDSCGGQSQVQFEADNDTDYYIFISGFGNTTGDFTLTISCFDQQLGCSEQFYDSGGATSGYQNGEDKVTLICPQIPGDKINVLFNSFDLSNAFLNNDFLQVFDGNSIFATPLHTGMGFSGVNLPSPLTAQNVTGCLTFRFLSDYGDNGTGWNANVSCITCTNSVNTTSDDILGSLRWAIYCAAPNSTIQFSPALNNSILNVSNSPLILNKNLNFHQTLITSLGLRSINSDRILDISSGNTVSLKHISLYSESGSTGRAIRNQGNLTLEHVNIFDQQVPGSAILNTGNLNILGNVNLIREE